MPTVVERKGRFTSQVRLRGFQSRARTFDTHAEAMDWGKRIEAIMGSGSHVPDPEPKDVTERAYESCGVYFLFKGSECVYVGQSLNVNRRMRDHRTRIDFDVYTWMPVTPAQLAVVERMYINALRPVHNHMHVIKPRVRDRQ